MGKYINVMNVIELTKKKKLDYTLDDSANNIGQNKRNTEPEVG